MIGGGKPSRSSAHHSHSLVLRGFLLHADLEPLFLPPCPQAKRLIFGMARARPSAARTTLPCRVGAHAPQMPGHGVGLVDEGDRLLVPASLTRDRYPGTSWPMGQALTAFG